MKLVDVILPKASKKLLHRNYEIPHRIYNNSDNPMVGFPGETEADFKELLTFIKAVKFDNMGAFTYSAQDGTPAARMVDQVTEEIKENRYHELMAAQAEISEENNRNLIERIQVLVEELLDDGCGNLQAKGRASFQAPEVDGNVYIGITRDLRPGDFVGGAYYRWIRI